MKKVLIVSFFFPPTNAIGSVRVGKFAKYLGDFGWEPWVLTIDSGLLSVSEDLPVEIPEDRIVRADFGPALTRMVFRRKQSRSGEPPAGSSPAGRERQSRFRLRLPGIVTDSRLPDRGMPWYLPAIRAGSALLARQRFDAIVSSHGPPASSIVASILARRHSVPWVADFRDLWTQNHGFQNRPRVIHWLERRVEKRFMRHCRAMTTVSIPLKEQLERLHGKPVNVIMNGFDAAEYSDAKPARGGKVLRIVYTGMIYEGEQDPTPLFHAVRELIDAGILPSEAISIEFYGVNPAWVAAVAASCGVGEVVSAFPRMPQSAARAKQREADVLLVLDWTSSTVKGYASGKVFEYFGARKPILGLGPRSSVIERLLTETRAGEVAASTSEVKAILKRWLAVRLESGTIPYEADASAMNRYSRRAQTQALAAVLDSVVSSRPPAT